MSSLIKLDIAEVKLLLGCARTQLETETIAQIKQIVETEAIAWDYIIAMAQKHRILPLLYRNLNSFCKQALPRHIHHQLQGQFFANTRNNFRLTQELLRLLPLFTQRSIRVIPYKGTVLAATVYGKVALRQVWDLDLLIAPTDVSAACQLLEAEGYQIRESFDREKAFVCPETQIEVDLHWGLTPIYFPIPFDFEQFWQRRQEITLVDTRLVTFSAEDLLLILCIQVAKDCWERRQHLEHLSKVCDVAELLRDTSDLDWGYIFNQAEVWDAKRIVYFGLGLAQKLLAASVPEKILTEIEADSQTQILLRQVCGQLFGEIDRAFASNDNSLLDVKLRLRQLQFYWILRDRPRYKLQYLAAILQTLTKALSK
ncbi:MAG: nucleotidyltransferase family protein [Oscillatoria sp. PMC 1068.18]|nr:nucleotidyltransferase family protein [Oscillatoria sp. PMC 1076.18]MEC4988173.1 nucleotidyltransferase family protein [Oscillatoria sp. PMC 1068.18]